LADFIALLYNVLLFGGLLLGGLLLGGLLSGGLFSCFLPIDFALSHVPVSL
jgi:hypothetical protein